MFQAHMNSTYSNSCHYVDCFSGFQLDFLECQNQKKYCAFEKTGAQGNKLTQFLALVSPLDPFLGKQVPCSRHQMLPCIPEFETTILGVPTAEKKCKCETSILTT